MLRTLIASVFALVVGGCALSQSTDQVVLDYNRDFAKSRNEVLLLNILRAAAREPLQFSTMGQVNGAVGNGSGISLPFTNLIAGGKNAISPTLTVTDAINPSITISPLAGKEFASGILSPMRIDTIQLFLHNGWDPEFLLPLIVGGVVCPKDNRLLLNGGEYLAWDNKKGEWVPNPKYEAFKTFFYESAVSFNIGAEPLQRKYELDHKGTLSALKDGVGPAFTITGVEDGAEAEKKILSVQPVNPGRVNGLAIQALCDKVPVEMDGRGVVGALSERAIAAMSGGYPVSEGEAPDTRPENGVKPKEGRVVFRSVGSIIQHLGESHRIRFLAGVQGGKGLTYKNRDGDDQTLFKVDWGLRRAPKAVQISFQDTLFYVPRMMLGTRESTDRTLKTFSFLDQLIALQTSESSIRGAQPVISVNQ